MAEKKEVTLTIGVFAGILNNDGTLLIQRRKEKGSIVPGKSFLGDYELPGGGLTPEEMEQMRKGASFWSLIDSRLSMKDYLDHNHFVPLEIILPTPEQTLMTAMRREILEEEGLVISNEDIFCWDIYRAILIQKKLAKIDVAISMPIYPQGYQGYRGHIDTPRWSGTPNGEFEWADAERIKELCQKPKGEQILSGWGKRMCQMMLWCLVFSPDLIVGDRAEQYLLEIHQEKGYLDLMRETLSVIE